MSLSEAKQEEERRKESDKKKYAGIVWSLMTEDFTERKNYEEKVIT